MVLAFSLQTDVKSIGAYAGFAAIIGLALLVLLYFAQAREVRRMSDLLEEQENRLRSLPASARQLTPRPIVAAPGGEVPTPQPSSAQPPSGASTTTVAVPGARRVAIGGAAAGGAEALAPPGAAGAPGTTAAPGSAAPVAAATVAGAMAAASAAPAAIPGDGAADADAPVTVPRPREHAATPERPDAPSTPGAAGSADGASGEPPSPSASVPLSARPAATAEPVGAAQLFDRPPALLDDADEVSPDDADDVSPDTAETAIVEGFATGQSAASESAEAWGAGAVAVAAFEPEPAAEISAERLDPSGFDLDAGPAPAPASEDDGDADIASAAAHEEPPPLRPSTPAGARPRFPPSPQRAGALPVAAAAAASAAALEGVAANGGTAKTRRRERSPATNGEDLETHAGGSVIRLLAAAVVIVAVLIFIATKVLGTSSPAPKTRPPGPVPATITVAVLNGTHASGLASQVSTALSGLGFKRGFVGNALSHGHHVTLVGYTAPADLAAAKEVAKDLGPNTRVGPADAATKGLAEAQVGAIPDVIVTLGSEYTAR
jgi:hypothetical protein